MSEEQQGEVVVEQPQPKKRRRVLVDVSVVSRAGQSALVQWAIPGSKRIARGFVPVDAIEDGKCALAALEAAQRYGTPWGRLVSKLLDEIDLTPQRVEDALYAHGIWTVHDIEQNTAQAMQAISGITGKIVPILHGEGGQYEKQEQLGGK